MATTPPLPSGYSLAGVPPPPAGYQVTGAAAPPPQQAPQQQAPQQQAAPAQPPPTGDDAPGWRGMANRLLDPIEGIGEGVTDSAATVARLVHAPKSVTDTLQKAATPDNDAQRFFKGGESIAEFLMGDEALKGLSMAEKATKVASSMKAMEKAPALARFVGKAAEAAKASPRIASAIAGGARQGVVGGVQAYAHGADAGDAALTGAETAAIGGGTEGLLHAGGALIDSIRPGVQKIAGEEIPQLASQRTGKMNLSGATLANSPEVAETINQKAQRVLTNTARDAYKRAVEEVNATRAAAPAGLSGGAGAEAEGAAQLALPAPETALAPSGGGELATGEAAGDAGGVSTEGAAGAAPQPVANFPRIDPEGAAANIEHYGDAAAQLQKDVSPVYQTLDTLSGGKFTLLRNAEKQADAVLNSRNPASVGAIRGAMKAKEQTGQAIEGLFDEYKAQISPQDFKAAQTAWRTSKLFEEAHGIIEGGYNGVSRSAEAATAAQGQKVARELTNFTTKRVGKLTDRFASHDLPRVFGPDGITNLYRVADLLRDPAQHTQLQAVLHETGKHLTGRVGTGALVGGAIGHATGVGGLAGGAAGAATEGIMRRLLHGAATNPALGKQLDYAVRMGVTPKFAGGLLAALFGGTVNANRQPAPQTEENPL